MHSGRERTEPGKDVRLSVRYGVCTNGLQSCSNKHQRSCRLMCVWVCDFSISGNIQPLCRLLLKAFYVTMTTSSKVKRVRERWGVRENEMKRIRAMEGEMGKWDLSAFILQISSSFYPLTCHSQFHMQECWCYIKVKLYIIQYSTFSWKNPPRMNI